MLFSQILTVSNCLSCPYDYERSPNGCQSSSLKMCSVPVNKEILHREPHLRCSYYDEQSLNGQYSFIQHYNSVSQRSCQCRLLESPAQSAEFSVIFLMCIRYTVPLLARRSPTCTRFCKLPQWLQDDWYCISRGDSSNAHTYSLSNHLSENRTQR